MASKAFELLTSVKDFGVIEGIVEDSKILQMMNLSQWKIFHAHFPWASLEDISTIATVDGTGYTAFPTTAGQLLDVVQAASAPYGQLKYVPPDKFHQLFPQPTQFAEGKPTHYTWHMGRFWWYPIPDAAYNLSVSIYKKPINMKVYSAGTAVRSGTTVTGTSSNFLDNANVDTSMFFAYTADVRSDRTYPWSAISAIGSNTSLTIGTYAGADASGTYICSSASTFPEEFDMLLIYESCILLAGKSLELAPLLQWFLKERDRMLTGLVDSQKTRIPFKPILEDFGSSGFPFGDYAAKYPFIFRDV